MKSEEILACVDEFEAVASEVHPLIQRVVAGEVVGVSLLRGEVARLREAAAALSVAMGDLLEQLEAMSDG